MALNNDILLEIALIADYQTTLNLLVVYPQLNTIEFCRNSYTISTENVDVFWKKKCQELYPDKTYLSTFSGPENFLLKERTFSLVADDEEDLLISSELIEYHPVLDQQLSAMFCFPKIRHMKAIKINVSKEFIVLKRDEDGNIFDFYQSDKNGECKDKIIEDAKQETYDSEYYIINTNDLTFSHKDNKVISYEHFYDVD